MKQTTWKKLIPGIALAAVIMVIHTGCSKDYENMPPQVVFLNPLGIEEESKIALGTTLHVMALANDKDGEVKKVKLFVDDRLWAEMNSEPWTSAVDFEETGYYYLNLVAVDNEGLESEKVTAVVLVLESATNKTTSIAGVVPENDEAKSLHSYPDQLLCTSTGRASATLAAIHTPPIVRTTANNTQVTAR